LRLIDLLDDKNGLIGPGGDVEVTGLASDSRDVRPGYLFAALPGAVTDGGRFVAEAVDRGAVAVLAPPDLSLTGVPGADDVALLRSDNPRRRLAQIAARFHGTQPAFIAAVTGTNGKTSVAWFTRQIWSNLGHQAVSLGTLGISGPGMSGKGGLTTPDPIALHGDLAGLAAAGVQHLVMEASSHGLAQHRLDGVAVSAGAFTNLSRDHLDYHGSMEDYRNAKLRLFSEILPSKGTAVLNADSAEFEAFASVCKARGCRVIDYGAGAEALRILSLEPRADGQSLRLRAFGNAHLVELPLPGAFQASNALCAAGLAIASGDDPDAVVATLARLEGVPGRLQLAARAPCGAPIYVDYAHTPDALSHVLKALRPHTAGQLIVVFGCGGDRDSGKRPMMGAIADELADIQIVTDDNPRGEEPARIRAEILKACPGASEFGDRAEAIFAGVARLTPGDTLVIAGKGHETGQIVGDTVRPFDDAESARAAVVAAERSS
jgi:UDP-N-acetylmuramoyl-L-alanyl-D-glutamate--2,6-diaminopimelate ligase